MPGGSGRGAGSARPPVVGRCYGPVMGRRWRPRQRAPRGRGAVALAAAAAVLVIAGAFAIIAATGSPAPIGIRNLRIAVVDGPRDSQHVTLDATLFTPAGSGRVPAILLAHGFGATKDAVRHMPRSRSRLAISATLCLQNRSHTESTFENFTLSTGHSSARVRRRPPVSAPCCGT